jgi:hypothetical protein
MFFKENLPITIGVIFGALLLEPLVMYRRQRVSTFSFDYYVQQLEFFVFIITPLLALLFWLNWREMEKQGKKYGWVGKFEVIAKGSSFLFCYLFLAGRGGKIRVDRALYEKTRVGDSIFIYRDSLGNIEEVEKVSNYADRVARLTVRYPKKTPHARPKSWPSAT